MSVPFSAMRAARFCEEDWRRMARSSAEYCLFWEIGDSRAWIRVKSQGRILVVDTMRSASGGEEARFSKTPRWVLVVLEAGGGGGEGGAY